MNPLLAVEKCDLIPLHRIAQAAANLRLLILKRIPTVGTYICICVGTGLCCRYPTYLGTVGRYLFTEPVFFYRIWHRIPFLYFHCST